jgi:hypothetical protein
MCPSMARPRPISQGACRASAITRSGSGDGPSTERAEEHVDAGARVDCLRSKAKDHRNRPPQRSTNTPERRCQPLRGANALAEGIRLVCTIAVRSPSACHVSAIARTELRQVTS